MGSNEENSLLNSIETTNGILPSQIENIIKFKPTFAKRKVNTTLFTSKRTTNTQKSASLKQKSMSMNQNSMSMNQNSMSMNQNSTSMNQHSMSMNQNSTSISESINESISSNESDGNSSWNSSQNSCILPSQIENIIKVKPAFATKVMPRMEAQVPNFSSNMQQKLQEFKQAFSQEIPSVEQSKNEFKKPANPVKSKKKHGRSDIMQQILKRKSSSDENDGNSSLNSSQSSSSLPSQVDSVEKAPAPPKKPAPKKIKVDEDIPGFAEAGCLHKRSTVAGLRTWLASVGVPTKAKSKKDELIQKALEKLGYTTAPMTVEFEQ